MSFDIAATADGLQSQKEVSVHVSEIYLPVEESISDDIVVKNI